MKWDFVPFGDVCHLVNGKAFRPSDWSADGVPIIRIQNLNGSGASYNHWGGPLDKQVQVEPKDMLLAWSGTPGTSFGAHIWKGPRSVLNQHIFRVDLDAARIVKEWAVFTVNHQLNRLIDLAHGGVGLKHVTRGVVEELRIPLPPISDQRRITAILAKADDLRSKRRAAINCLEVLPRSMFSDLFGDPVTNPKGWRRRPFGEVLEKIDSGWSPVCLDRPVESEEWGMLKLGAVTWCEYDPSQNKALLPHVEPDPDLEVKPGDLLFSRKNTYELVAACALVRETPPRLMISDLIFRFRLKGDAKIDPCYLHQLLIYPTKRREIQKLAGGSAGSMPNISKARLQTALIEVPPEKLQREFAKRAGAVERLKTVQRAALTQMDKLFSSLQYRAFRGEL